MLDLTKQEKIILVFLSLSFLAGWGLSTYKKIRGIELNLHPAQMTAEREKANELISEQKIVNINSWQAEELTRLPGIGETLAQRIIEYHRLHGPFKSKEELLKVKGIGEKKLEMIRDLIVLQ